MANPLIDTYDGLGYYGHIARVREQSGYGLTPDAFGAILARQKIYHRKDYENRINFLDWFNDNRSWLSGYGLSRSQINQRVQQATKSKTWLDAMKAYEDRQNEPGRYAPNGFEGLGNIDIFSEVQARLQRRDMFGRRRSPFLTAGVEEAPQGNL